LANGVIKQRVKKLHSNYNLEGNVHVDVETRIKALNFNQDSDLNVCFSVTVTISVMQCITVYYSV